MKDSLSTDILSSLIACPHCGHTYAGPQGAKITCLGCGGIVPILKGVYYFHEIKNDIQPEKKVDPKNPLHWSNWRRKNYDFLQRHLPALHGMVLLDIGAGQGQFRTLYEDAHYVGIDFYDYEGVSIVADITKRLPLKDRCADIVVLSNVLEHVPTPETFLAHCFRVLKPGGMLFILVPFMIKVHQAPFDFLRYTHFMIQKLLEDAGFSEISITPIGDIFDIHSGIQRDYVQSLFKRVREKIPYRALRIIPLLALAAAEKVSQFSFASARMIVQLCGVNRDVSPAYIQGYGVVASIQKK